MNQDPTPPSALAARPRRASTTRPTSTTPAASGFIAHIKGRKSHAIVRAGPEDPREPDASRRDRRRSAAGRRRRHPDPAAGRVPAPRLRQARDHAAGDRPVRRRRWCSCRRSRRRAWRASRKSSARLPLKGRFCSAGATYRRTAKGLSERTKEVEPVIRQVFVARGSRGDGPGRARAQALRDPQARRPRDPGAEPAPRQGVLRPVVLDAHDRLQGNAARAPGRQLLPRPRRRVDGLGAGDGAPALLDQHVPDLGPRAPVPLRLPQRRDQHAARQLQLDPRARGRDRRRQVLGDDLPQAVPADLRRPVGLGVVRQRARAARHGRLSACRTR